MATVINFISPFSQFDAYIHKLLDIDIWFLATKRKLRKSPAFQFLVLAVNHFVLMAILNTCNISIKHLQWYVYLVCYIYCIYSRWIRWTRFLHPYRYSTIKNPKHCKNIIIYKYYINQQLSFFVYYYMLFLLLLHWNKRK